MEDKKEKNASREGNFLQYPSFMFSTYVLQDLIPNPQYSEQEDLFQILLESFPLTTRLSLTSASLFQCNFLIKLVEDLKDEEFLIFKENVNYNMI